MTQAQGCCHCLMARLSLAQSSFGLLRPARRSMQIKTTKFFYCFQYLLCQDSWNFSWWLTPWGPYSVHLGSRTEQQCPVHGEAHSQPSLQIHSLEKNVCEIFKCRSYSVHEFISSLLPKMFLSSSFIFRRVLCQERVSCLGCTFATSGSPQGAAWAGSCAAGSCREQVTISTGRSPGCKSWPLHQMPVKCQAGWSRGCLVPVSLFRLRGWPGGLLVLLVYKKSSNNPISSAASVHSDENYSACISFTHLAKIGGFNNSFLFPSPAVLISHLNRNKYKDLSLIVEDSQEMREKE